jgi:hypothetical protein
MERKDSTVDGAIDVVVDDPYDTRIEEYAVCRTLHGANIKAF